MFDDSFAQTIIRDSAHAASHGSGSDARETPAKKESRPKAAFRGMVQYRKRVSDVSLGAPSFASYSQVFQIPQLSHETWITSFRLFARLEYVCEINEFQAFS